MYQVNNLALASALFITTATAAWANDAEGFDVSCKLDNGQVLNVGMEPHTGAYYHYGKDIGKPELSLESDKNGVSTFYFFAMTVRGNINYLRFHKGVYDYVVMSKDLVPGEFYGVQVYKKGKKISSHECADVDNPIRMDFSQGLYRQAEESEDDASTFAYNE